jgi:hypothetical protein
LAITSGQFRPFDNTCILMQPICPRKSETLQSPVAWTLRAVKACFLILDKGNNFR